MSLRELQAKAVRDPEGFWGEAARAITFRVPPARVLDASRAPFYRWFVGGELNTSENCLDRHVAAGRGDQLALIYDSPVTGTIERYTYRELLSRVEKLAGALAARGIAKGDRVVIYLPMIPEAAIAMLACARLGAVHSVVFGGFAAKELAARIDDAKPKLVLSASCGIEPNRVVEYKPLLDEAIRLATHAPERCIIKQRAARRAELVAGRDEDWDEVEWSATPHPPVPVESTHPLYILYTSGTTGSPKGVLRDNGGHAVALAWSMEHVYGVKPGEVFWAASDVGWVVGHSYIVYGPLLHGCTTVLYEGKPVGTPDAGAFFRVIAEHGVSVFFTAPTAFRAIRREDPEGKHVRRYDLSKLRALFLAGERSDPTTVAFAEELLGVPVVDHYWQTETGWPIAANCLGIERLPVKHGSPTKPVPGWDIRVLDEFGKELPAGEIGSVVVKLPLPPGSLLTIYGDDERYVEKYLSRFPGFYETADAGYLDEDGYLFVMARTDDVINVAGHRLSTGALEEALASHPDVAECAVVGVHDELKGQLPLGFVVLKDGVDRPHEEVEREIVALVRERIGPVAAFRRAVVVPRLPKTRSGKILRKTMQAIAEERQVDTPATIDDPRILSEIGDALRSSKSP